MAKIPVSKKRKVDGSAVDETAVAGDKAEHTDHAGDHAPSKSEKTSAPKKRKIAPKTTDLNNEVEGVLASDNLGEISANDNSEKSGVANAKASDASDLHTTSKQAKAPAKRSRPKKQKIGNTDATQDVSPNTSGLSNGTSSPKDSGKDTKEPKKRAPSKKTTTKATSKKKKEATETRAALPPPAPPPLTQQVANKVKQVLLFINNEQKSTSKLERDPENPAHVSMPYSTFLSAVMRIQTHYEIPGLVEDGMRNVQDAVIGYTTRNIGPTPNIDWVTIDTSKDSMLENIIKQKIAGHGLADIRLLEIELEMFTKGLLEQTHLFRDTDGYPVVSGRLLDAVASAEEEEVAAETKTAD